MQRRSGSTYRSIITIAPKNRYDRYTLIGDPVMTTGKRSLESRCDKCNMRIHQLYTGHHKCGYGNCPVCKAPILNQQYWIHVRSHPGHENDAPSPSRGTFGNWEKRRTHSAPCANNNSTRSS
ncbi:MAG: hypothetical protein WAK17_29115 [Candidatus Nitrosopolaris sp.]|jgi:hypothetical protein